MSLGAAATAERRLRDAIEPFHGLCYYVPEVRARYVEVLGLHPWAAYFAQRASPMGAVGAEVVTALFYGFSPRLVGRSIPAVWESITPAEAWEDRVRSVSAALDRLLSQTEGTEVDMAASIAAKAVAAMEPAGRPQAAALAAMAVPDAPLMRLWRDASALREYRGDGHVAALVSHGLGPRESLITSAGFSNLSLSFHQRARGWSEEEWSAGVEHCRSQGWIDAEDRLTDRGLKLRLDIESTTDRAMAAVTSALTEAEMESLTDTLAVLSRQVIEASGFPA